MSIASRSTGSQVFAARARRRRLRRLATVLLSIVVAAGLGTLTWLVGWSDVLAVRHVEVTGAGEVQAAEALDVAEAPIGTPLIRVDTRAIAQRVRELPETESVDVHRSWPDTLTIEVTPRVATAAMRSGERWYGVDESGTMFGESASRTKGLPVLEASSDEQDQRVRAAGVQVLTGLPDALLEQVEHVDARSEADVRLELDSGAVVELGTPGDLDRKVAVLQALMKEQDDTPAVYDVSAPGHPAVTP